MCVERFLVIVNPRFDDAVVLFERQTGLPHPSRKEPPDKVDRMRGFFDATAAEWAKGSLGPERGRLVCRHLLGLTVHEPGGNSVFVPNSTGVYGPLIDAKRQRFSVYDVYLPWSVAMLTEDGAEAEPAPGWLIISYAWNNAASIWQPWRVTFNDPNATTRLMRVLWI